MIRIFLGWLLSLALFGSAGAQNTVIGTIVAETGIGCVRFVVATSAGYTLMFWDGGSAIPWEGDMVRGALHKTGSTRVAVEGRGFMEAFVENYGVDAVHAGDFFYETCKID